MVEVFCAGIELFVNPISDVDSFPMVAGRSEVVGVCAFAIDTYVDTPVIKEIIPSMLAIKSKLIASMFSLCVYHSIKCLSISIKWDYYHRYAMISILV